MSRSRKSGFSLLEVLSSIFIAAACATVLSATIPVATKSRIRADYSNKATSIAQRQLERIRGQGYANLTPASLYADGIIDNVTPVSANTYTFNSVDTSTNDSCSQVLPGGSGTVTIVQSDTDLRQVTVTINYNMDNRPKTVVLGTMVANL
ncbi:MAG: hypothetical protein K8R88_09240 [Armatimonadetes bacterium]|nr:hypothetical protein [Armatimonadota bacterium]